MLSRFNGTAVPLANDGSNLSVMQKMGEFVPT